MERRDNMGFKVHGEYGKARNDEVKTFLGLDPNAKLPNFHREAEVAGTVAGNAWPITIVLLTKEEAKALHPRSSKPRRIHARCPACHRLVCAGHSTQHTCKGR
jgi:hypothetical protein